MSFQTTLRDVLPEKLALPGSESYNKSNGQYFTSFESNIKPAAIAQPTNSQEVGFLVQKLQSQLKSQDVMLAIKGTGHTPFAGK